MASHARIQNDLFQQRDAIHRRHVHVTDDQVTALTVEFLQRLLAIGGFDHFIAALAQCHTGHGAHRGGVVDNEDFLSHFRSPKPRKK